MLTEPDGLPGHDLHSAGHHDEHGPDERVAEAEGCRGELVRDVRLADAVVVLVEVTFGPGVEVVAAGDVGAEDAGEELAGITKCRVIESSISWRVN